MLRLKTVSFFPGMLKNSLVLPTEGLGCVIKKLRIFTDIDASIEEKEMSI